MIIKSNEYKKHPKSRFTWQAAFALTLCFITSPLEHAFAEGADVVKVEFTKTAQNTYRFDVTLRHDDEGWDHYANQWQVIAPDGSVLATRVLAHPHVNEQPFTRSKSGIKIPKDIKTVTIRAGDSVHGFKGKEMKVQLN